MTLAVDSDAVAAIRAHAREAYPQECCGALLGGDGREAAAARRVVAALPSANERADSAANRFLISGAEVHRLEGEARRRGLEVVGFYHSHPDHPAEPSAFDREHAWPWYSYVILAVRGGRDAELRSWRLRDDRSRFDEEPWKEGA